MISEKIEKLLNKQIGKEQFAAQYYLSMSAYFEKLDLVGIAGFFREQSKEELAHADKIFDYLCNVDGTVVLQTVDAPPHEFVDPEDVFAKALEHEKEVTQSIFEIYKAADQENDYATKTFLQWFIDEQVDEESEASLNLNKIKMVKDNSSTLYLFDQELGERKTVVE